MSFNAARYMADFARVLAAVDPDRVERIAERVHEAWRDRRTVFVFGNGGSAASASHIAADLSKLTAPTTSSRRLRVHALNESASAISAIANDIDYSEVFAEQLRTFMQPGDVVIGLSTSGRSPNVIKAIEYANANGATTVGIMGDHDAPLRRLALQVVVVDSKSVQQVEDTSMVIGHLVCLSVAARVAESLAHVHVHAHAPARTGEHPAPFQRLN